MRRFYSWHTAFLLIMLSCFINILTPACQKKPVIRETNQFITLEQSSYPIGIDLPLLIDESGSMFGATTSYANRAGQRKNLMAIGL